MLKIRTTKTGSGKTAVQVVERHNRLIRIVKHLGSAGSFKELTRLKELALAFIREKEPQQSLLDRIAGPPVSLTAGGPDADNLEVTGYHHQFAYEFLSRFYALNGFEALNSPLLKDLALLRIIEPASKRRSLTLLKQYFGIRYSENFLYKNLPKLKSHWALTEKQAVNFARENLAFDFSLVFYDVTTLYFETFKSDEDEQDNQGKVTPGLRKCGFSKDNKANQPQILIGLAVNRDGYPITAQLFEGDKFEGRTIIPMIRHLKKVNHISNLTVVADAAMLSADNLQELEREGLSYIVGARLSNLKPAVLEKITAGLGRETGKYFQTTTSLGTLVCDYSQKRADKDKADRKKQLLKAQRQIDHPGQFLKRPRFVQEVTASTYRLNEGLVKKAEALDGIKGYYTNLKEPDGRTIVERYKDLWKIEKAFRIAKSDLLARPVFHFKRANVETHLLIVFISLCVTKTIELKTKQSIKRIRDQIWEVLDIQLRDTLTGKTYAKRTAIPEITY